MSPGTETARARGRIKIRNAFMDKDNHQEANTPKENPIEDVLKQLEDVLNFLETRKDVPINETVALQAEIADRLEKIETMSKEFHKLSDEIISLTGISREELLKRKEGKSDQVPPEGRHLIQKSNQVRLQADSLRPLYQTEKEDVSTNNGLPPSSQKSEFEKIKESKNSNFGKKRRGKFKQMGGDKDWKPL